jgi:hypothetical protein
MKSLLRPRASWLVVTSLALLLALTQVEAVYAQVVTGTITGAVRDPSGAAVTSAPVKVSNVDTGITKEAVTDSSGNFQFQLLQPGRYRLEASASGFKMFRRDGLTLEADRTIAVPVDLQIGESAEVVEVQAGAPLLDVETSELGNTVDNSRIADLPVNGRNPLSLVTLTPGVQGVGQFGRDISGSWAQAAVVIGGGNALSNGSLIDGMANDKFGDSGGSVGFLTAENVQEIKIITNAMAAEYGNTGGGIVSVISKSGTNHYRGSAFEYVRNNAFNANDFFSNAAGAPIPPLRINQFGGNFGGPIIRNRFFFYATYEHDISRTGTALTVNYAPSDLERTGNFSQTFNNAGALITIYDPLTTVVAANGAATRSPFNGNLIPPSRISQASQVVWSLYPKANLPGLPFSHANNLYQSGTQPTSSHDASGKVDYLLRDTQRIALRYSHTTYNSVLPNYFGNLLTNDGRTALNPHDSGALQYTNTLSPTLLLDAKVGVNRDGETSISPSTIQGGYDITQLGFPASLPGQLQTTGLAPNGSFPCFNVNDLVNPSPVLIGGLGVGTCNGNQSRNGLTWSANAAVSKITGKHTIKTGYEFRFYEFLPATLSAPTFTFTRGFTQGPNPTTATSTGGFGIASFELGYPATGTATYGAIQAYSNKYNAAYVQDDWKLTRRLTLNLGVRWEYNTPVTDRFNTLSIFDPALAVPLTVPGLSLKGALKYPGVGDISRSLTNPNHDHFGPRFGFAYQANDKLVVRGGYGIIYVPLKAATFAATGFSSSTSMVTSLDNGLTPKDTLSNPFPSGVVKPTGNSLGALTGLGQSISGQLQDVNLGYVQQWNLTVQYQPIQNWLTELAYLGNKGTHLISSGRTLDQLDPQYFSLGNALNQSVPNPFFGLVPAGTAISNPTVSRQQLLLPYPQFTAVNGGYSNLGNSNYHAFQFKVEKRLTHGVAFSGSYVFGKIIDAATLSTGGRSSATPDTGVVNWYNLRAERSVSVNSVAHRVVGSVLWQIPTFRSSGWVNGVLGGWQLNVIPNFQTGRPLAVSASSGGRPNVVAGQNVELDNPGLAAWFNTKAYSLPAAFSYGNSSRTIPGVVSDGIINFDSSLFKDFRFRERYSLQFRVEAFNIFNHVTFDVPNLNASNASFGTVTAQAPNPGPRRLQLGMRLSF